MPNILSTDARLISYSNCNPQKQKTIIFEQNYIKIVMGSETLYSMDISNFVHAASANGGSFKKRVYIQAGKTYNLYGGNISQDQGEVSMIIIRVIRYDQSLSDQDQIIFWEYLGNMFPLKNLLFLTGKTLDSIKHHGWNLEPYLGITSPGYETSNNASSTYVPSPEYIIPENNENTSADNVLYYSPDELGYSSPDSLNITSESQNLSSNFTPFIRDVISSNSPDLQNGGIIIKNTTIGEVELEILVMN